ncbi:30S ribosome-binding factor RbfA [Chlorobium phaeobacteroides]|uniref:Ribosome-binding factor A n=1 Tax=Chlorobium phaeobacteroides (strain DSM 266 / SMG 266 / 2430) TaxID=290317 RepID=RBFA_CHLPD|nr:30S ribosome-binding factor RbfA [Chlorobium phaeobacteroides]A1BDF2.1 RecName: Full=Ribosome-binding factor A [Chlorobium phaeobacteroides DSM 266]ABL64429.1 ribosome-binding factor A [Chlorobium phaeobacteroides DSM 266]
MSIRTEKVASLLQQELGMILEKEFPRGGPILTVVEVKVTADLGIAKVYVSVIGSAKEQADTIEYLQQEKKNIRKILSSKIRHHFRRIPELEFYQDRLYEKADRIEQLLKEVRKEQE